MKQELSGQNKANNQKLITSLAANDEKKGSLRQVIPILLHIDANQMGGKSDLFAVTINSINNKAELFRKF